MARIDYTPGAHCVEFVEYEQGWGSRLDERRYFDCQEDAVKCADEYNAKYNNAQAVPSWYISASYIGQVG